MGKNRFRLIPLLAALAVVAGCSDVRQLRAENEALRAALQQRSEQRQADLRYLEEQSSLAAGCDFLVPMCPDSIASTGRQALAQGFGGGTAWPFWLAMIGKLAALGAGLGGLLGVLTLIWVRIGRPSAAAIAEARQMVHEAGQTAMEEGRRADQAQARVAKLDGEIAAKEQTLASVQKAIAEATTEHEALHREVEKIRAAKAALTAFH